MKFFSSIFLSLFLFSSYVSAKDLYMYNKVKHIHNSKTELINGIKIKFKNKVELKTGFIYTINKDKNNYGFEIGTTVPIGR